MRQFAKHCTQRTLAVLMSALLSACGGSTNIGITSTSTEAGTNDTANDNSPPSANATSIALTTTQSGGCIRLGPNCAIHRLYDNGSVDVRRTTDGEVTGAGQIDTGLLDNWLNLVATTDFSALRSRLPAGQCAGCVDGVDFEYEISANGTSEVFNSIDFRLDNAEPFFALTNGMYEAMQVAAPLEMQSR